MKRSLRVLLVAVAALSILSVKGCIFSPKKEDPQPIAEFVPQTSPEAVVANLVASYRLQNIEEYSRLLAPEYIFKFQPVDAAQLETEFWTRDQDTTGTDALFSTPLVSQITINLTHGNAVPTNEVDFPPGTMTIRINQTQLEVDQTDGITWLAQDIQDMFFRQGDFEAGEDSTNWFLIEWRDIPTSGAPRLGDDPLSAKSASPGVTPISWGALRQKAFKGELELAVK